MSSSTDTAVRLSLNGHSGPNETQLHFETDAKFGEEQSKKVGGDPQMLENFFFMFYDQDNETATLRQTIYHLESDNEKHRKNITVLKDGVFSRRLEIQKIRNDRERQVLDRKDSVATKKVEIKRIRGGDYSLLNTDKSPANRPAYFTALIFLIILTVYLINFYASVIYNSFMLSIEAIFNNSGNEEGLSITSVVVANMQAFPDAYKYYGVIGVIFLFAATFMFLTLGFLMYYFSNSRRIWMLYVLYLFTFIFDGIMAYEIVRKIHFASEIIGESEPWHWKMAFQSADFYLILFAGFGMYIAWGFLLKYILEEYHKILPALVGIRRRKAEIKRIEAEIKDIDSRSEERIKLSESEIADIEQREIGVSVHAIENNEVEIQSLRKKMLDHLQQSGMNAKQMREKVTAFLSGWCHGIRLENAPEISEKMVSQCHMAVNRFYTTVGLS